MSARPRKEGILQRGRGKTRFLYQQLADILRKEIQEGHLKPGDLVPSMDALARAHQLNKATVRQALAALTAEGLIYSQPARGTFVSEPASRKQTPPAERALSIGWISHVSGHVKTGRYHTEMMDAVRNALNAIRGNLTTLHVDHMDPSVFFKAVGEAHLDGAILVGPFQTEPIKHLIETGLPCVLIDDVCRGARTDSILVDNKGGGYLAMDHLLSLGHKRVAIVTGPHGWRITQDRLDGAYDAMDAAGMSRDAATVFPSDFSPEGGFAAFMEILKLHPLPTAVFFENDEMAAGALHALYEQSKLRVPENMSFVGFDDISWTQMTHPPLTTVHVEKEMMGREAVERLAKQLFDPSHVPYTTILPTRLVVRKSTDRPQEGN